MREATQAEREATDYLVKQEAAQAKREFQLEMVWIPTSSNPGEQIPNFPKLHLKHFPVMEKDGDLKTFLHEFEKTYRQFNLPHKQWRKILNTWIKMQAWEALVDLPPEIDQKCYDPEV